MLFKDVLLSAQVAVVVEKHLITVDHHWAEDDGFANLGLGAGGTKLDSFLCLEKPEAGGETEKTLVGISISDTRLSAKVTEDITMINILHFLSVHIGR
jgi:hypothetical protein